MKRKLLKMTSILLVSVLVSAPTVGFAEEAVVAEKSESTEAVSEDNGDEDAGAVTEASEEESSENTDVANGVETAENTTDAAAAAVVEEDEISATSPQDSNPGVQENTYIGQNIGDITLPEGYIVNYEEVTDEKLNDIVLDQYTREDGVVVLVVATLAPVEVEEEESGIGLEDLTNPFALAAPAAENSSYVMGIDWDSIPAVYEYNWDNSSNCWYYGVWIDGVKYTTPEGTYDTNVRHKMQMYSDGTNVYLRIVFAREFGPGQIANSNDYNFYFDGQYAAKFQIAGLTGKNYEPGEYYNFKIAHGDSAISSTLAEGAEAIYHVTDDGANNEVYLKIPFSAFEAQCGRSLDGVQKISYYSPNLMRNHISCAGSSTGGWGLVLVLFTGVIGSFAVKGKNLRLA